MLLLILELIEEEEQQQQQQKVAFVLMWLFLYGPFCLGAIKHDPIHIVCNTFSLNFSSINLLNLSSLAILRIL